MDLHIKIYWTFVAKHLTQGENKGTVSFKIATNWYIGR